MDAEPAVSSAYSAQYVITLQSVAAHPGVYLTALLDFFRWGEADVAMGGPDLEIDDVVLNAATRRFIRA